MCKKGGPRCEDKLSHAERAERLAEQAARRRARRAELKTERERLVSTMQAAYGIEPDGVAGMSNTGIAALASSLGFGTSITVRESMLNDTDHAVLAANADKIAEHDAAKAAFDKTFEEDEARREREELADVEDAEKNYRQFNELVDFSGGTAVVSEDGTVTKGDVAFPPEQGEYGDVDDFVRALDSGETGWEPVRGRSGQHGAGSDDFVMCSSEMLPDPLSLEPGTYSSVMVSEYVYDDDGELIDEEPTGWVLLRKRDEEEAGEEASPSKSWEETMAEQEAAWKNFTVTDEYGDTEKFAGLNEAFTARNLSKVAENYESYKYTGRRTPEDAYNDYVYNHTVAGDSRGGVTVGDVQDALYGNSEFNLGDKIGDFPDTEEGRAAKEAATDHAYGLIASTVASNPVLATGAIIRDTALERGGVSYADKGLGAMSSTMSDKQLNKEFDKLLPKQEVDPLDMPDRGATVFDVDKALPPLPNSTDESISEFMGTSPAAVRALTQPEGTVDDSAVYRDDWDSVDGYLANSRGVSESVSTAMAGGFLRRLSESSVPQEVKQAVRTRVLELHANRGADPETPIKMARLAESFYNASRVFYDGDWDIPEFRSPYVDPNQESLF